MTMTGGAGIGGAVVEGVSLSAIGWTGAQGVAAAAVMATICFRMGRAGERTGSEQKLGLPIEESEIASP